MGTQSAILVLDYINEIIHPDGKFKSKGYADFAIANNTLEHTNQAIKSARKSGMDVIFVRVGFSHDYKECPEKSPLFKPAKQYQALLLDTWATEFHAELDVQESDVIVTKHRISPFYQTDLESVLIARDISDLYLCGVATDLVVQSAARDAHDRNFNVYVLGDCCTAANLVDQHASLSNLEKIAKVVNSQQDFASITLYS